MSTAALIPISENYSALGDSTDKDSDMLAGFGGERLLTSSLECAVIFGFIS